MVGGPTKKPKPKNPPSASTRSKGLSWKEGRELEALPGMLEALEAERDLLGQRLADPATYQNDPEQVGKLSTAFEEIEAKILEAYARWEDLESRAE